MRILLINPPASKNVEMVREGRCMQRKGAWSAVWAPISLAYLGAFIFFILLFIITLYHNFYP